MGIYLNPGNDLFTEYANSQIYVDKSGIIGELNKLLKTANKYVDGIIETKLKEALKTGNFEYFTKGVGANLITEEAKTILPELMTSQ